MEKTKELFQLMQEADALNPDLRSNAEKELQELAHNAERPYINNHNPKTKPNVKK